MRKLLVNILIFVFYCACFIILSDNDISPSFNKQLFTSFIRLRTESNEPRLMLLDIKNLKQEIEELEQLLSGYSIFWNANCLEDYNGRNLRKRCKETKEGIDKTKAKLEQLRSQLETLQEPFLGTGYSTRL